MRVQYFKTKAVISVLSGMLGVLVAAAANQPTTPWQWTLLVAGMLLTGCTSLKSYLLDPNREAKP